MTKTEFEENDKPLVLIASLNIGTGEVLYDIYDWQVAYALAEDYKKDFPDFIHFTWKNKASINEMKKVYGLL